MRRRKLILLLAVAAACSDPPVEEAASTTTTTLRRDSGCPVEPELVAEAVDLDEGDVEVEEETASLASCTYLGPDDARVVVVVERLTEGRTFADERAEAEAGAAAGTLEPLGSDVVAGAQDGWIITAGRAVQVAAGVDRVLVTVAVAAPSLSAAGATAAAATVAAAALAG